jgi:signal transduction histidine kinase
VGLAREQSDTLTPDMTDLQQQDGHGAGRQGPASKLLELQDRERRWIACEIHDGFVQSATAALMSLQALRNVQQQETDKSSQTLDKAIGWLRGSIDEARRMIGGLRPPLLDECGVLPAIEHLVSQIHEPGHTEIIVHSDSDFNRLTSQLDHTIYRIVQESLTNAVRHSNGHRVEVRLTRNDSHIRVEVEDWGIGFDPKTVKGSRFGLTGIRERAVLLGGSATIDTTPGKGTRITVELPILHDELKGEGLSQNHKRTTDE